MLRSEFTQNNYCAKVSDWSRVKLRFFFEDGGAGGWVTPVKVPTKIELRTGV